MTKKKCHQCNSVIFPANAHRVVTRVSDSFDIKTFCNKECVDRYYFHVGVQAAVIIILIIGIGLAWLLK